MKMCLANNVPASTIVSANVQTDNALTNLLLQDLKKDPQLTFGRWVASVFPYIAFYAAISPSRNNYFNLSDEDIEQYNDILEHKPASKYIVTKHGKRCAVFDGFLNEKLKAQHIADHFQDPEYSTLANFDTSVIDEPLIHLISKCNPDDSIFHDQNHT